MSGRKYTTVQVRSGWDAEEYARRQAEQAKRDARGYADNLMRQARRDADARAQKFDAALQRMRKEQADMCDAVHQQIDRMTAGFSNSLDSACTRMEQGLQAVRQDVSLALMEQEDRLRDALQAQGQALHGRLDRMERAAASTEQFARDVMEVVEAELHHIQDAYLHELFCPGEVNAIVQRLQLSRDNLNAGRGASALPLAQESLLQVQHLHARLEQHQQQWETRRLTALAALDAAEARIGAEQEFRLSLDSQALADLPPMPPMSTDYWSGGELSKLKQEMEDWRARMNASQAPLSLAELEAAAQAGDAALTQLASILRQAHDAALASIHRADMQMDFYDKLLASGYVLEDNAWEKNDERLANHMVMRGVNGDRLAIIIRPELHDGVGLSNRVEVNFLEAAPSEIRRREKLDQLTQVLASVYDIPAAFTPMPGEEWTRNAPSECFDLDQVRAGAKGA